jgi:hypothetical protein
MRLLTLAIVAALPLAATADTVYRVSSFVSERSPGAVVRVVPGPDLELIHLPVAMRVGAFDAAGQRLFLLGDSYLPNVYVADLHDQSLQKTAVDLTALSSCCAWDAQTSRLFALRGSNELVQVDLATGSATRVLSLNGRYSMLTSDPARHRAFLLREDSAEVWAVDLATLAPSMLLRTAVTSAFVDASTGTLYVSTPMDGESFLAADLFAIDVAGASAKSVLHNPGGIPVAFDAAAKRVYVQKWNDFNLNAFWSVDLATGATTQLGTTGGDFNTYVTVGSAAKKRAVR